MKKAIMLSTLLMSSAVLAEGLPPGHPEHQNRTETPAMAEAAEIKTPKIERPLTHLGFAVPFELNAKAACNLNATGSALVAGLLDSDASCANGIFGKPSVSDSDRMIAVANAAIQKSPSYDGVSGEPLGSLFLYMRGLLYNESKYNSVTLSPEAHQKGIDAINAFTSNPVHYTANSVFHGENIKNVLIKMDSTDKQELFIDEIEEWLNRFTFEQSRSRAMRIGVNPIFTTLYRAFWNPTANNLIINDPNLWDAADSFANRNLHSLADFMKTNLANEFGRRVGSDEDVSHVKSNIQDWITTFNYENNQPKLWMKLASHIDFKQKCSTYNTCTWKDDAMSHHLPDVHSCSSTIKIRAQDMSPSDMTKACALMGAEETYFHPQLDTKNTPVTNDNNSQLEVIVFDDYKNYQSLAGVFFGIGTDNGGMYLEGDPSKLDNQARFIAHEVWWDRSEFAIWNLEHEYIHYLDARFNLHGNFSASWGKDTVFWSEGLAEYASKKNKHDTAKSAWNSGGWELHQLVDNSYESGQNRIYTGGYLAVRFLIEKHPDTARAALDLWRAGSYDDANVLISA